MDHEYHSMRAGTNPNPDGLPIEDIVDLLSVVFRDLGTEGYFGEAFGFWGDQYNIIGTVTNIEMEILRTIRKKNLWPITKYASSYSEDDFLDVIEFLYQYVSKLIDETVLSCTGYGDTPCITFNKQDGQNIFREKINTLLGSYKNKFELSKEGKVLCKPDEGFEQIFNADIPSNDANIVDRINAATTNFRRRGSGIDGRRQAVIELASVLEYIREDIKKFLTTDDENDLFNIANNFGIRHHNEKQKTAYDANIWLSWMFYFYLSTIHVVLRKIDVTRSNESESVAF